MVNQHMRELQRAGGALELVFGRVLRQGSKSYDSWCIPAQMRTFDYFFGLRLGILLLRHSDNLRMSLQAEDLCVSEAQTMAKSTVNTLKNGK